MQKITGVLLIGLLLLAGPVQAKEVTTLTLDQAIKLGVKNSSQLQQLKKSYQQQQQELKLYKDKYPFNLGVDVNSDYNLYEQEEWLKSYSRNVIGINDTTGLTVTNHFSPRSNLVLKQQLLEINDDDEFEFEGQSGSVAYNHYLFKEYNQVEDYQLGLLAKQIAVLEKKQALKDFREQLKLGIVNKYYQLLKLQKKMTIKQEMLEQSKLTLKTVKARVDTGEALQLDQKEAALEVKEIKLDLAQLKEEHRLARQKLADEVEVNLASKVKLTADQLAPVKASKTEIKKQAVANNLEFKLLTKRIDKQEYQVQELTTDRNINLKLTGEVGWRKEDSPKTDYRVGVQLNYHFNNYEDQTDELTKNQQQVSLNKLRQQLTDQKQDLKFKVEQAWVEFAGYQAKLDIYQQKVDRAQERLEVKRRKYKAGLVTLSELLAVQVKLSQQKVDYLNNLIDYNQQVYQIKQLQGQL